MIRRSTLLDNDCLLKKIRKNMKAVCTRYNSVVSFKQHSSDHIGLENYDLISGKKRIILVNTRFKSVWYVATFVDRVEEKTLEYCNDERLLK